MIQPCPYNDVNLEAISTSSLSLSSSLRSFRILKYIINFLIASRTVFEITDFTKLNVAVSRI